MASTRNIRFLLITGLTIFCLCSWTFALIAAPTLEEAMLIMCSTLAFVVLLIPVVMETHFNIFHPLCFFSISVFMGATARSVFVVMSNSNGKNFLLLNRSPSSALPGAALVLLGCCCISCGYALFMSNYIDPWRLSRYADLRTGISWNDRKLSRLALFTLVISSAAICVIFLKTGGDLSVFSFDQLSQKRRVALDAANDRGGYSALGYEQMIANCVRYSFYMCLISTITGSFASLWKYMLCISTGILTFFVPFFSSSRSHLIYAVVTTLLILSWGRAFRFRHLVISGCVVLTIFFVMGNLRTMRDHKVDSVSMEETLDSLMATHNYVDITKYSHLIEATPYRLHYLYGSSYFTWIWSPIPRSIWPDKPLLTYEIEFTEVVYGGKLHATGIEFGGTPIGVIAEGYRNFGLIGSTIASFLFGIGISYYYRRFNYGYPITDNARLLYAATYALLSFFASDIEFSRVVIEASIGISTSLCFIWLVTDRMYAPRLVTDRMYAPPME